MSINALFDEFKVKAATPKQQLYQIIHHVLYSETFLFPLIPWRQDNGRETTVCR